MMIMKKLSIYLVFVIFTAALSAQSASIYSRYGLGDIYNTNSAKRFGMGGLGSAFADKFHINSTNPAAWYNLDMTRFEIGLDYKSQISKDNNGSAYYSDFKFSGFTFGFPIDSDFGISAAAGLTPVTNINYQIVQNANFGTVDDYIAEYSANGGLSKVFLGGSYTTPLFFTIGAAYEYYTGNIDYISMIDFGEFSSFRDVSFRKNYDYHGMGINAGFLSENLAEAFGWEKITDFRFAAALNYISKLNTDTSITSTTAVGQNTQVIGLVKSEIPYKLTLGSSLRIGNKHLLTFDYLTQPWSKYKINGIKQNNLRDLQKVVLGYEFGDPNLRFVTFWEQILWRVGLSYEQTQYEINGEGINEYSIYAGVSFPIGIGNTLDFGFRYGMRGTTSSNLVREDLFNAFVSFSFGELWFVRQER